MKSNLITNVSPASDNSPRYLTTSQHSATLSHPSSQFSLISQAVTVPASHCNNILLSTTIYFIFQIILLQFQSANPQWHSNCLGPSALTSFLYSDQLQAHILLRGHSECKGAWISQWFSTHPACLASLSLNAQCSPNSCSAAILSHRRREEWAGVILSPRW